MVEVGRDGGEEGSEYNLREKGLSMCLCIQVEKKREKVCVSKLRKRGRKKREM